MKGGGDDRIYRKTFICLGIFKLCAGTARDVRSYFARSIEESFFASLELFRKSRLCHLAGP